MRDWVIVDSVAAARRVAAELAPLSRLSEAELYAILAEDLQPKIEPEASRTSSIVPATLSSSDVVSCAS